MAVTLRKLCERANYLYGMRVLAGGEGMDRPVQWVHVLEDAEAADFLHGGELIFTTGIAERGTAWLTGFAEELYRRGASGLVVSRGPQMGEIPEELLDFCGKERFPLLDLPRKTKLVDITRDFCGQIFLKEKEEEDIGTVFKNLMHAPEGMSRYLPALKNHHFDIRGKYWLVAVSADCGAERRPERLRQIRQLFSRRLCDLHVQGAFFEEKEEMYAVLEHMEGEELRRALLQLQKELEGIGLQACLAVNGQGELKDLPACFRRGTSLLKLAGQRGTTPVFYEDLGIEKLLISVEDRRLLEEYVHAVLGPLEAYDQTKGTHFEEILKMYLSFDGSVQKVAEASYVHRNTVNYQINRIKKILGRDLGSMEERLRILLAFQIQEIL